MRAVLLLFCAGILGTAWAQEAPETGSPVEAAAESAVTVEAPVDVIVVTAPPPIISVLPTKGTDKRAVERDFGKPSVKKAPVGGSSRAQPPITRWDYDGFSVFFEHDHVVDSVQRGNPAPIKVYDGLAGGPR